MNFTVKYTLKTVSRYGSYLYGGTKTVNAETLDECRDYVKKNAGSWYGVKRFSVQIKSITEQ